MNRFIEKREDKRILDSQKNTVVFYHGDCQDGFSAAWAARKSLGESADYVPVFNGQPFPVEVKNKKVFFIDVLPVDEVLKKISVENNVISIDHHKTNNESIKFSHDYVFDISKSGAVLAWEYFHPGTPVPLLLKYVQDMDLWHWNLPDSRELAAFICTKELSFDVWDTLNEELENSSMKADYISKGSLILDYENILVKRIVEGDAQRVDFEGHTILVVNSSVLASDIGNYIYTNASPFGVVWQTGKDSIRVSLRSNGSVDVGVIAQKYGGGGHKASAGFTLPLGSKFPWKIIKENNEE